MLVMNQRRIIDDRLYAHFITFSVYRRRRLLDYDHPKRILLGTLADELEKRTGKCIGFVIMPDHVHLIVGFPRSGQLGSFMHGLKRKSSFRIRNWYRAASPEYFAEFGEGDRFWQRKYYSFELDCHAKIEEKLTYIHLNPVRAGLVSKSNQWRWSSARKYEQNQTVGIPIQWVD